MSNKTDKLNDLISFIQANQDKDFTWCAKNNGIVSYRTFFNWKREGLLSASPSASASVEEDLRVENLRLRNRVKQLENLIHDMPYKESEFKELKGKYERLQVDYMNLKEEVRKQEPEEEKEH